VLDLDVTAAGADSQVALDPVELDVTGAGRQPRRTQGHPGVDVAGAGLDPRVQRRRGGDPDLDLRAAAADVAGTLDDQLTVLDGEDDVVLGAAVDVQGDRGLGAVVRHDLDLAGADVDPDPVDLARVLDDLAAEPAHWTHPVIRCPGP
jgi:hypothetical protein